MILNQPDEFLSELEKQAYAACKPVCARAVLLIEPVEFTLCHESAIDNPYMNLQEVADPVRALQQWHALEALISEEGIEVISFPGDPQTPDAVFPNNVFASTKEHFIIGHMLHPGRQREAEREDIRAYFKSQTYGLVDLSQQDCIAELTGPLIIDAARQIGFCGMTGRVDAAGLEAMHKAFGLNMIFSFALQPGEYHTNVVMMVLAGRACVIYPGAFVDPAVPEAIETVYAGRTLVLNEAEKNAFAGNCIALTEGDLFMSQTGVDALRPSSIKTLKAWGFTIHLTQLDEIEKAGGSLRCMVAEIF